MIRDPDARVQETLRTFFATFRRVGSAIATVKEFRARNLCFPSRRLRNRDGVSWRPLTHSRALYVLHNPRYAGAFAYGRTRTCKTIDGGHRYRKLPREEWAVLIPKAHEGYITWEAFEANQKRLLENSSTYGAERRQGPPREGNALLQGLVLCGACGKRMTVRYNTTRARSVVPIYSCQRDGIEQGKPSCQWIVGGTIDDAVGKLVVELMTPRAIDIALMVQKEIEARAAEVDALRAKSVEQARYEADLARRHYMHVEPENRLVANALEAEWNHRLRDLADAQDEYERQRSQHGTPLAEQQEAAVRALVEDFPTVWNDVSTPQRERERLLRLLVEDVTLLKGDKVAVHIRLRGGQTRSLSLPRPIPAWKLRQTDPDLVAEIDRLIDHHTDPEIVAILNERGHHSGEGRPITLAILRHIKRAYELKPRRQRLREQGLLTLGELADKLKVSPSTIKRWRAIGLLVGHPSDGRRNYLYGDPGPNPPRPRQGRPRKTALTQT